MEFVTGIAFILAIIGLLFWRPSKGKIAPPWFSILQLGTRIVVGLIILLIIGNWLKDKFRVEGNDTIVENNSTKVQQKFQLLQADELIGCWHYSRYNYNGYIYINENKKFVFNTQNGGITGIWNIEGGKINLFYKDGDINLRMSRDEIDPTYIDPTRKLITNGNYQLKWFSNETEQITHASKEVIILPPPLPDIPAYTIHRDTLLEQEREEAKLRSDENLKALEFDIKPHKNYFRQRNTVQAPDTLQKALYTEERAKLSSVANPDSTLPRQKIIYKNKYYRSETIYN